MSLSWKTLEIRYPVVGTESSFPVRCVSSLRVIERLHCRQTCGMAVAALIRKVAAEIHAIALLGGHRGAVHDVLRPCRCRLHPLNELAGMIPPFRIFIGMQQHI